MPQVVDHDVVAVRCRALDGLECGEAVAQRLEFPVDRRVVDMRLAASDLETLVGTERGDGAHSDLDRERQRLALGGQIADVELGLADGHDPGAVDCVDVPAAERAAKRFVEHRLAAEAADHHRWRDLPLAESRDSHLPPELARCLLEAALNLLRGHLRVDADARFRKLGDACLDRRGRGHA